MLMKQKQNKRNPEEEARLVQGEPIENNTNQKSPPTVRENITFRKTTVHLKPFYRSTFPFKLFGTLST